MRVGIKLHAHWRLESWSFSNLPIKNGVDRLRYSRLLQAPRNIKCSNLKLISLLLSSYRFKLIGDKYKDFNIRGLGFRNSKTPFRAAWSPVSEPRGISIPKPDRMLSSFQLLLIQVTEIQRQMLEGIVMLHLVKVSILKDRKHKLHRESYNAMPSDLALDNMLSIHPFSWPWRNWLGCIMRHCPPGIRNRRQWPRGKGSKWIQIHADARWVRCACRRLEPRNPQYF